MVSLSSRLSSLLAGPAALLAFAGCASAPATSRHTATVATPSAWHAPADSTASTSAAPASAELARWWQQFDDPALSALVATALQSSPDLRTAVSRVTESRARYASERTALAPSLSASVSGSGSATRSRATSLTTRTESYSAGLDASWELDLFGRERLAVAATRADLAETEENLRNTQASLAAEVATALVTFRSTAAQIALVEQSLASQTETAQIAQWREQAGLASALDTQQALSALEQARASLPTLHATLDQTRNQLALLCGRAPGGVDALLVTTAPVPHARAAIAVGIPADTLRQRPDVRAAEQALTAAAARTRSAERSRFPSLALSGSIGLEALSARTLRTPDQALATVLGNLTAPIFDAGKIRQSINIQSALEEQAFVAYESAVLTALSDVENALVSTRRQQESLVVLERAVAAAQSAATLAAQQYAAGQSDLLTVLEAQRTLLSVEQQRATVTAGLATAQIQLYKALGGGWETTSS